MEERGLDCRRQKLRRTGSGWENYCTAGSKCRNRFETCTTPGGVDGKHVEPRSLLKDICNVLRLDGLPLVVHLVNSQQSVNSQQQADSRSIVT
jgi:hypothetical protein